MTELPRKFVVSSAISMPASRGTSVTVVHFQDLPREGPAYDLFRACEAGDLGWGEDLTSQHPDVNLNWQDSKGFTPLMTACSRGFLPVVRHLLALEPARGLRVDMVNKGGNGALFMATRNGNVQLVKTLLADPRVGCNPRNPQGLSPFFLACQLGLPEVVKVFLDDPRVDVNTPESRGAVPLFIACQQGHDEVVSLLLADERVEVNFGMVSGMTPFYVACQNGFLRVVQLMLASGRGVDLTREHTFNTVSKTPKDAARLTGMRRRLDGESEEEYRRKQEDCPRIVGLLEAYEADPVGVQDELRRVLGINDRLAAETFALLVFLQDGHLLLPENPNPPGLSAR